MDIFLIRLIINFKVENKFKHVLMETWNEEKI